MKNNYFKTLLILGFIFICTTVFSQGTWKADSTLTIISSSTAINTGITGLTVMHSDASGVIGKGDKLAPTVTYNGITWDNLAIIQGSSNGMYYALRPESNGIIEVAAKMGANKTTFFLELTDACPDNADLAALTNNTATGAAIYGTSANYILPMVTNSVDNSTATWNGTTAVNTTAGTNLYTVLSFPVTANKTYVFGVNGSKFMLRGLRFKVIAGLNSINFDKESLSFQNPANGKLIINTTTNFQAGIYNTVGSLVKIQLLNPSSNIIDISDLKSGIYFIRDMSNNYKSGKFVIE